MTYYVARFVTTLAVSIGLSHLATAQQADTALVVGTVSDATGALIPGVEVNFNNVETGITSMARTNKFGSYRSGPLWIGTYTVVVETDGFKTYSGLGVSLSIGDVRELNVTLEVGDVEEVIEVEASVPLLQTTEGSAGTVFENRQIVDLPLNGRDYLQLAVISAGTVVSRGQGISIGGQRGTEINFIIDGVDNNNQSIASQGAQKETVKPSVDAIAEFKVITNGFSAEYGKSSSGVVSLAIKSGTNELHGTGFFFVRDAILDARNYFASSNAGKPPFRRRQYGFSVGGPIDRNRSFFFGDLELTGILEPSTSVTSIPTRAMRQGDFSGEFLEIAGRTIYDPFTAERTDSRKRRPFPNQIIPASRFDPISAIAKDFYPEPGNSGLTRNNTFQGIRNRDSSKWDIRWDHVLSGQDKLFARWSSQQRLRGSAPALPPTANFGSLVPGGDSLDVTSNNTAIGWNHIWNPSIVSNVRLGWNYLDTDVDIHGDVPGNINKEIGLPGFDTNLRGMAVLEIGGYQALGNSNWAPNFIQSQTRQVSVDSTWTRGNHAIKFGVQVFFMQTGIMNPQLALGRVAFPRQFTRGRPFGSGGDGFADFLLGTVNGLRGSNTTYMNMRSPYQHFYLQNDWMASDRLTLNLGLRYEYNPPFLETRDGIGYFDPGAKRPDSNRRWKEHVHPDAQIDYSGSTTQGEIKLAGLDGTPRRLTKPDTTNFAPRLGMAYRLTDKTAIRMAYGISYGTFSNTGGGEYKATQPPFHFKVGLSADPGDPAQYLFRNGLPPNVIGARDAIAVEMSGWEPEPDWPMAQNWNFNIQHSLPGGALWEIGYFGNKMNHMMGRWDENVPRPGEYVYDPVTKKVVPPTGGINERRPWRAAFVPSAKRGDVEFPGSGPGRFVTLGRSNMHSFRWNSLYHGLQTKLEKRYSKGMTCIASYSWSHAIGDWRSIPVSGGAPGENARIVKDVLDLSHERGPTPQDMRHRLIGSVVYELPFFKGATGIKGWLADWAIGSIMVLASGTPATPRVQGASRSNINDLNHLDRPDVVAGQDVNPPNQDPSRWWNPDALVPNQPLAFGDAGKGILRIPGRAQWDFSLYKSFRYSEKLSGQFRFEAFNFTNSPQFNAPNTRVGDPNFGIINSVARSRNLQLGFKMIF